MTLQTAAHPGSRGGPRAGSSGPASGFGRADEVEEEDGPQERDGARRRAHARRRAYLAGRLHDTVLRRPRAEPREEFPRSRRVRLLRRHAVSPRDPRLHHPGRRPAHEGPEERVPLGQRGQDGRQGQSDHAQARVQRHEPPARNRLDGPFLGPGLRLFPVLHRPQGLPLPGPPVHGIRGSREGDGRRGPHRGRLRSRPVEPDARQAAQPAEAPLDRARGGAARAGAPDPGCASEDRDGPEPGIRGHAPRVRAGALRPRGGAAGRPARRRHRRAPVLPAARFRRRQRPRRPLSGARLLRPGELDRGPRRARARGRAGPRDGGDAPDLGAALIEDLGDRDLSMDLADAPREDRPRLLDEAEELLSTIRTIAPEAASLNPAFDAAFFETELEHTRHWALEQGGQEPLEAGRAAAVGPARASPRRGGGRSGGHGRPRARRTATTTRTTSCAPPTAGSRRSTFRTCASGRPTTTPSRSGSSGPARRSRPTRAPTRKPVLLQRAWKVLGTFEKMLLKGRPFYRPHRETARRVIRRHTSPGGPFAGLLAFL